MAPKNKSLEDMVIALQSQLETVINQLRDTDARFDKLESLFMASQKENAILKNLVVNKDSEILHLKNRINDIEQHNRSCCARIFNIPIDGEENDPQNVMRQLYNKLLLPILQGAVERKRLHSVPSCDQIIQTAHVLPGKDNRPKPIFIRFFHHHIKIMIMQLKKDFAPRSNITPPASANSSSSSPKPRPLLYPIYDDLTRDAFTLMRALNSHRSVQSCWSAGGVIKYRLIDDSIIRRVSSIYASVESIIAE